MMDEKKYGYRAQFLVLTGAGLLVILLVGAWISGGKSREWKAIQKAYQVLLEDRGGQGESTLERGIFQVDLPGFKRSDRCISCHLGLEDPGMQGASQPHASHPGTYLEDHPIQRYGCTICHGGQPGALSREEAFGRLPETHWSYPLLEEPYLQASCGKCHLAVFSHPGGAGTADDPGGPMEEMGVFMKGLAIFSEEGCLGCHQARNVGGILGPDLTEQGEKTKHDYSFQNVQGEQTVSNWLKEHFRDPEMVSPGSQMLKIDLDEGETEALATFVLGLAKPDIPFEYFSVATLDEFKGQREPLDGEAGFSYFCSACHGKQGEGKGYEAFHTGIPAIGNPDFKRVASLDYIRFTLEKGRSLRQMGSWSPEISGLKALELNGISSYLKGDALALKNRNISGMNGNVTRGAALFDQFCKTCHGTDGMGGVAVALNQEGLLNSADNQFILTTIIKGRGNTAMPGWSILEDEQLQDLLACISSWRKGKMQSGTILLPEADLEQGALRYHFLCSRCHGDFGEGETGPAIMNREFLEAADDTYLYRTIARGRSHTAMFGWSTDLYNQEKLELQDISNIIGYMRSSGKMELSYVHQGSNPGQGSEGAVLFEKHCSECHGLSGEGVKAPALNNQELLSAASNGYLLATITIGRSGTAMPSWGYGDEKHPALTGEERQDLVAHIRSFQRIRIKY